jgi:hypothetical protein
VIDLRDKRPGAARRFRSRWLWLAVPAVVLLAGGAIVVLVVLRDPAEPVSVDEAVTRFRDREGEAGGGDAGDPSGSAPPAPGVYVYATTGSEGVDALDGSEHAYPAQSTVTVTAADDGCLSFRWDALVQRWDDELLCPTDGGWSRSETTLFHSFFNQDETRSYTCDAPGFVPPPAADDDTELTWTCDSAGSGRSGESHEEGTGQVMGLDPVYMAGVERPALHVRYETEVSGETTGGGTVDRWYALDRYPLVLREVKSETTSSETAIGTVHYHEDYELELTTWDPQR